MPQSLTNFYQRVSRAIRRGNVYDADIPDYARGAVRRLELEFNWKHMWQESSGTIPVAVPNETVLYSGTAGVSNPTQVVDTSASRAVDGDIGKTCLITSGALAGERRLITDNTPIIWLVSPAFSGDPTGLDFQIVEDLEEPELIRHLALSAETYPVVKSVRYFAIVADSGDWTPVHKTSPDRVVGIVSGRPENFWMKSANVIGFDHYADKIYQYRIGWWKYSEMNDSLFWLNLCEDLFLAQTILQMQPVLRDDKILPRWEKLKQEQLAALLESEIVHEYDGQDSRMVPFQEEYENYIAEDLDFS